MPAPICLPTMFQSRPQAMMFDPECFKMFLYSARVNVPFA